MKDTLTFPPEPDPPGVTGWRLLSRMGVAALELHEAGDILD